MQTIYTKLKVNNEIELCEIADLEMKQRIEKVLLKGSISYYVKWMKPKLFGKKRCLCILCVNGSNKDEAETAIKSLGKEIDVKVKFILRKSDNNFF